MSYPDQGLKICILISTSIFWIPILCLNQWLIRPLLLVFKQFASSCPRNLKKALVVFLAGVLGFAVIQLMFIGQSFVQMPKNINKFMKCSSIKIGYKMLIWEDKNSMENNINEFFNDIGSALKPEYEEQKDYGI